MRLAIIDATVAEVSGTAQISERRYAMQIANLPLISHVLGELTGSGIGRAIIVAHHDARRDLGRILGSGHLWGIDVSYVEASEADARFTVLSEVEHALSSEPVLLHPGDCLFGGQVTAMRERFCVGDVDSVLPEQASVTSLRSPDQRRVTETLVALGPQTRHVVSDLLEPHSEGDDLIASLLSSECRLAVCAATEHWCYSNSTRGLLAANRMMLDQLKAAEIPDDFRRRNELHGRISIQPTAYLSDCVLLGPVAIGEHAVLESSFIGAYTAVGAGAVIRGAEIDNSMILAGAEIHHPGVRLEGSIIGERARVTRTFQPPQGLHLRLGPDSQVELS